MMPSTPLEAVVEEIAKLKLANVNGYAIDEANHAIMLGLAEGAWVNNASPTKDRSEVIEEILQELTKQVLRVLAARMPGKKWGVTRGPNKNPYFEGVSTVLSFRWTE
jgi:hypothetical protein